MTARHASDDLVARYTDGSLPDSDAWSLEKHLESCTPCATRVSRAVRATTAGTVLFDVREAVLGAAPGREAALGAAPYREPALRAMAHGEPTLGAMPHGEPALGPAPHTEPALAPTHHTEPVLGAMPHTQPALGAMPHTEPVLGPTPRTEPAPGPTPRTQPALGPTPHRQPALGAAPRRKPAAPAAAPRRKPLPVAGLLARMLWAAGPAVRGAWLPAVLLVGLGAVVLAYGADFTGSRSLLLALAPVVPVAGVAFSYGAHADPLHELAAATPSAGLRLVLTRTAVVLGVSLPLLTLAGAVLPSYGGPGAAAWLLPGLALTLASLALGGWLGLRAATAVTGGGWLCAVLAPALATPDGAVSAALKHQLSVCLDGAPAQGAWAAAAVLCAALLAARRTAYDRLERP